MKVIILKENLNKGLNIIGGIIGRNLTLPILNNILLSAEKNLLNLTGTDLELGIKYWALCKTEKEGNITVPAKVFSNFINLLPEGRIVLEARNQDLFIECENYKTKIKGLGADDFPIVPGPEGKDFIEINSPVFCAGLSQVVNFTAASQSRPELSGIYLSFQKDRVQMAATDSFRLAEKVLFFEKKTDKEHSLILPQKSAKEVINVFSETTGKMRIDFSPNQVLFECPMGEASHPQIRVVSRLIDGEYPDYQEIIPQKNEVQVLLPREGFLNQIKAASVLSDRTNEVKIKVVPDREGIEVFSQNPELGENKSFLAGKVNYQGPRQELEVSFNHRFLVEGLANIKGSELSLELNGEDGPTVLRPKENNYLYIVMPIKAS